MKLQALSLAALALSLFVPACRSSERMFSRYLTGRSWAPARSSPFTAPSSASAATANSTHARMA